MSKRIDAVPQKKLKELWTCGDGMCTSWCIAIAHEDKRQYIYGDTGTHRACFDPTKGLVIDSSARIPIIVANTQLTVRGKTWTMDDGRLYSGAENRQEYARLETGSRL